MASPVTLLMAIHCHQPVGNFGFVFEDAYAKAYEPFLRVLERHPAIRIALHYSGCLLDWLAGHRPAFLERVKALADRGQVELLVSGYYEPILPLLPERDRLGQIQQMRQTLRDRFRAAGEGLWLTERVWEPELPQTLAKAGIRYTMVDTNQFAPARPWLPPSLQVQDEWFWDVLGCFVTEYAGASVVLFPASKRLRYWMPFQPVEQTIGFLQRLQRDQPSAITFADDGEKFGLWPKTFHWVYDEGWLEQFFSAVEREASWLRTATFHDYLAANGPDGRIYLPCGSYEEMLEWSGGSFRNFFIKYPEANAMQQKMLRVSRELEALRAQGAALKGATQREALLREAQKELYAGQCNCAYWHGVFGGLYLAHLRRAVYAHLIGAEALLRQIAGGKAAVAFGDADGDGLDDVTLTGGGMSVVVDPDAGGAVTDWSVYGCRLNLLDTLSRRYEPYHEKLKAGQAQVTASASAGAPASIHDLLGVKEDHLASHLVYDDHPRSAFLDFALQSMPSRDDVVRSMWGERRLWSAGPFQVERQDARRPSGGPLRVELVRSLLGGTIRKTVSLDPMRPLLDCVYRLDGLDVPVAGLEFNLALRDERYLRAPSEQVGVTRFQIEEPGIGMSLTLSIDPAATLMHFPIETISESEEGLERTYQGLCVLCLWLVGGVTPWTARLHWMVEGR